jgi:C-terminal processing protease CtpA/Prc
MHLLGLVAACVHPPPPAVTDLVPAEVFAEDLDLVVRRLEEVHPAPWHATSQAQLLAHAAALRAQEAPRTPAQVYRDLAGLLALVGDTHTSVVPPGADLGQRAATEPLLFPVEVELTADGALRTLQAHGELAQGARIVSIGGQPTREAIARWRAHTSGDTEASRDVRIARRLSLYLALDGLSPPFSVEIEGEGEAPRTVPGGLRPAPVPNTFSLGEDGVGVLDLRATWDPASVEPALAAAMQQLRDGGRGLVVDLRRHEGGSLEVAAQVLGLFTARPYRFAALRERKVSEPMQAQLAAEGREPAYLAAPLGSMHVEPFEAEPQPADPAPFTGPVAFVTGPMGHVTTALWLGAVSDHDLAPIVGQPLGELPTNYSESYRFALPRSGLEVWIASARYVRPSGDLSDAGPVAPDLAVPPGEDALAAARRWVLEQAAL